MKSSAATPSTGWRGGPSKSTRKWRRWRSPTTTIGFVTRRPSFTLRATKTRRTATATGFDSIVDNPNFTGGPFSWYVHQGIGLAGTSVNLKQPDSLVPDLRTSKTEGQANFVNPGLFLAGLGTEIEVTPKLRNFMNLNFIRFMDTEPLKDALFTDKVAHEFGWDLSTGLSIPAVAHGQHHYFRRFGRVAPAPRLSRHLSDQSQSRCPATVPPAPGGWMISFTTPCWLSHLPTDEWKPGSTIYFRPGPPGKPFRRRPRFSC